MKLRKLDRGASKILPCRSASVIARKRSCRKVMFSPVSICPLGVGITGTRSLPGVGMYPPPPDIRPQGGVDNHPPLTWNHEIRLASGRYASYWNDFLFIPGIIRIRDSAVHSCRFTARALLLSAGLRSLDESPADFPLVRLPALLLQVVGRELVRVLLVDDLLVVQISAGVSDLIDTSSVSVLKSSEKKVQKMFLDIQWCQRIIRLTRKG